MEKVNTELCKLLGIKYKKKYPDLARYSNFAALLRINRESQTSETLNAFWYSNVEFNTIKEIIESFKNEYTDKKYIETMKKLAKKIIWEY